jgi:hypothetical protein
VPGAARSGVGRQRHERPPAAGNRPPGEVLSVVAEEPRLQLHRPGALGRRRGECPPRQRHRQGRTGAGRDEPCARPAHLRLALTDVRHVQLVRGSRVPCGTHVDPCGEDEDLVEAAPLLVRALEHLRDRRRRRAELVDRVQITVGGHARRQLRLRLERRRGVASHHLDRRQRRGQVVGVVAQVAEARLHPLVVRDERDGDGDGDGGHGDRAQPQAAGELRDDQHDEHCADVDVPARGRVPLQVSAAERCQEPERTDGGHERREAGRDADARDPGRDGQARDEQQQAAVLERQAGDPRDRRARHVGDERGDVARTGRPVERVAVLAPPQRIERRGDADDRPQAPDGPRPPAPGDEQPDPDRDAEGRACERDDEEGRGGQVADGRPPLEREQREDPRRDGEGEPGHERPVDDLPPGPEDDERDDGEDGETVADAAARVRERRGDDREVSGEAEGPEGVVVLDPDREEEQLEEERRDRVEVLVVRHEERVHAPLAPVDQDRPLVVVEGEPPPLDEHHGRRERHQERQRGRHRHAFVEQASHPYARRRRRGYGAPAGGATVAAGPVLSVDARDARLRLGS